MNEVIKMVLLAVDKFMPEMHLRQPIVSNKACGKFKETGDSRHIYQN